MKLVSLILAARLAIAGVIPAGYNHEHSRLQARSFPDQEVSSVDHTCVILRSTEWLAHTLISQVEKISARDAVRIFREARLQNGPLTATLRGMMIWTQRLDLLKQHLAGTTEWSTKSQLKVSRCYLDYTFQASTFLKALGDQAKDFPHDDSTTALTYDKIQALYLAHKHIATLFYGKETSVKELLDLPFPRNLDEFWSSREDTPKRGGSIAEYVRKHDSALLPNTCGFASASTRWSNIASHPDPDEDSCQLDLDHGPKVLDDDEELAEAEELVEAEEEQTGSTVSDTRKKVPVKATVPDLEDEAESPPVSNTRKKVPVKDSVPDLEDETESPFPNTRKKKPAKVTVPDLEDEEPDARKKVFEAEDQVSGFEEELPTRKVKKPPVKNRLPAVEDEVPTTEDEIPAATKKVPSNYDEVPEVKRKIPDTAPAPLKEKAPEARVKVPDEQGKISEVQQKIPTAQNKLPPVDTQPPAVSDKIPDHKAPDVQETAIKVKAPAVETDSVAPLLKTESVPPVIVIYSTVYVPVTETVAPVVETQIHVASIETQFAADAIETQRVVASVETQAVGGAVETEAAAVQSRLLQSANTHVPSPDTQIPGAVESEVPEVVESHVPVAVNTQISAAVDTQVSAGVDTQVSAAINTQVSAAVDTQVSAAVDTKVPAAVETKVPAAVETQVPAAIDTLSVPTFDAEVPTQTQGGVQTQPIFAPVSAQPALESHSPAAEAPNVGSIESKIPDVAVHSPEAPNASTVESEIPNIGTIESKAPEVVVTTETFKVPYSATDLLTAPVVTVSGPPFDPEAVGTRIPDVPLPISTESSDIDVGTVKSKAPERPAEIQTAPVLIVSGPAFNPEDPGTKIPDLPRQSKPLATESGPTAVALPTKTSTKVSPPELQTAPVATVSGPAFDPEDPGTRIPDVPLQSQPSTAETQSVAIESGPIAVVVPVATDGQPLAVAVPLSIQSVDAGVAKSSVPDAGSVETTVPDAAPIESQVPGAQTVEAPVPEVEVKTKTTTVTLVLPASTQSPDSGSASSQAPGPNAGTIQSVAANAGSPRAPNASASQIASASVSSSQPSATVTAKADATATASVGAGIAATIAPAPGAPRPPVNVAFQRAGHFWW